MSNATITSVSCLLDLNTIISCCDVDYGIFNGCSCHALMPSLASEVQIKRYKSTIFKPLMACFSVLEESVLQLPRDCQADRFSALSGVDEDESEAEHSLSAHGKNLK